MRGMWIEGTCSPIIHGRALAVLLSSSRLSIFPVFLPMTRSGDIKRTPESDPISNTQPLPKTQIPPTAPLTFHSLGSPLGSISSLTRHHRLWGPYMATLPETSNLLIWRLLFQDLISLSDTPRLTVAVSERLPASRCHRAQRNQWNIFPTKFYSMFLRRNK